MRYKARVVVLGNLPLDDELDDGFLAPMINSVSLKLLLALAVNLNYSIRHLDVKNAYLHAELKQEIYMQQPPGCEQGDNRVCKLNKSMVLKSPPLIGIKR